MADLTPYEQRCLADYFLHERGYTYDKYGVIENLTPQEESRLWKGRSLWAEHIENADADDGGATKADHQQFEEFASETGNLPATANVDTPA